MFPFYEFSPFDDLFRLRREMNDVFSEFDRNPFLRDPFFYQPQLQQQEQQRLQGGKDTKGDEKYSNTGETEQKGDSSMNVETTGPTTGTGAGAGAGAVTQSGGGDSLTRAAQNTTPARVRGGGDWLSGFPRIHLPKCDVVENPDNYAVSCELPGMSKEDVKLNINENGVMTISAERSTSNEQKDPQAKYHRVERSYGKFERSLPLPKNVDLEQVSAKHENGLLKIILPKKPQKADTHKAIQIQ